MSGEQDSSKKSDPNEDLKKEVRLPTGNPDADDDLPSWQKTMWNTYTDDYSKQIAKVCYNKKFDVLYNNIEVRNEKDLLFSEPKWTRAELILKNMSTLHTEYINEAKSEWIKLTRQAAMKPEDYVKHKLPIPPNYTELADVRQNSEKQYYEDAARIMFKIKIGNDEPIEMSLENYHRLERVQLKFAVDAVQLSLSKPKPKNEETSSSSSTYA